MGAFWNKNKGTITASVISACVGALIVQTFNVWNLTRSIKFQQNREILSSTRLGIGFLKQTQNELDENLALLMKSDYQVAFEFGKPKRVFESFENLIKADASSITNKAAADAIISYFRDIGAEFVHIDKV